MLSLSWASKFLSAVFFMIISSTASAELIKAEGQYDLSLDITQRQCEANALLDAKFKAMGNAGLEKVSQTTSDLCVESGEKTNCEMHEQTMNYFRGGYIKNFEILNQETDSSKGKCTVAIQADVRKYLSKPDVNFVLQAEITGKRRKFHGEEFIINGEVSRESHLYLFGYYPKTHSGKVIRIMPNDYEKGIKANGNFQIPKKEMQKTYKLIAEFPEGSKGIEIMEYIIVLATNQKLDMLSEATLEAFDQRLDDLGRENWQKIQIGYFVLKDG